MWQLVLFILLPVAYQKHVRREGVSRFTVVHAYRVEVVAGTRRHNIHLNSISAGLYQLVVNVELVLELVGGWRWCPFLHLRWLDVWESRDHIHKCLVFFLRLHVPKLVFNRSVRWLTVITIRIFGTLVEFNMFHPYFLLFGRFLAFFEQRLRSDDVEHVFVVVNIGVLWVEKVISVLAPHVPRHHVALVLLVRLLRNLKMTSFGCLDQQ